MTRRRLFTAAGLALALAALTWRWIDRPWTLRVDDVPASWRDGWSR